MVNTEIFQLFVKSYFESGVNNMMVYLNTIGNQFDYEAAKARKQTII